MRAAPRPIEARIERLGAVFAMGRLRPAEVQREYSWGKQHCSRLFNDLVRMFKLWKGPLQGSPTVANNQAGDPEAFSAEAPADEVFEGYFLGTIVLAPCEDGAWAIYDGQQRLTSLTILACVVRDLMAERAGYTRVREVIQVEGAERLSLSGAAGATLATEIQRDGATHRLKPTPDVPVRAEDRIRAAARFFRTRLRGDMWDDHSRAEFVEFFCDRIQIALIEVYKPGVARQVFESANGTGKALDAIDIFKGQLIDYATEKEGADAAEEHSGRWQKLREQLGDVYFAAYLRSVDFITRKKLQGEDHLSKLFTHLRKQAERGSGLRRWIDRLEQHASAFARLTLIRREIVHTAIDASLLKLYVLPWWDWQSFALYLLMKKGSPADFDMLQRACWRMALAGYDESERALTFERAFEDYRRGGAAAATSAPGNTGAKAGAFYFFSRHLTRARETLSSPIYDYDLRRAVALWLEAACWEGNIPGYIARGTSVEHVLPENPPAGSQWRRDFKDLEARNVLRQEIGNLCVVPHETNVNELKNHDFAVKREILEQLSSRFRLAAQVAQQTTWTADEISQRNKKLLELALAELHA